MISFGPGGVANRQPVIAKALLMPLDDDRACRELRAAAAMLVNRAAVVEELLVDLVGDDEQVVLDQRPSRGLRAPCCRSRRRSDCYG
jgi:hypothetical protein